MTLERIAGICFCIVITSGVANGQQRVEGTRTIHDTLAPNVDGRISLISRQIEETRSAAADVRETETTLLVPDLDGTLSATERTEYREQLIKPGLTQHDSTLLRRDINGRWQPVEARHGEAREIGASERLEEETIQRLDINGNLAVDEKTVRTTTATADGGSYTVEEVETRSLVAPSDPMRVTRRIVERVRQIGLDRWVTERQVFERDINDRLQLVSDDTEEKIGE